MTRTEGKVVVRGKIAYYSQQSWILSATVKENIVFGHAYDHEFYLRVLDACVSPTPTLPADVGPSLTSPISAQTRLFLPILRSSRRAT